MCLGILPCVALAQNVHCQDKASPGQDAQGCDEETLKRWRLGCLEKRSAEQGNEKQGTPSVYYLYFLDEHPRSKASRVFELAWDSGSAAPAIVSVVESVENEMRNGLMHRKMYFCASC